MYPIVTEIDLFGVRRPIGGYGLAVAIGVFLSCGLIARVAYRQREDVGATIATLGYSAGAGFLGSYLMFVIVEWARSGDPMQGIRNPGLVFYGAVPMVAIASYLSARAFAQPYLRLLDQSVPAIAAGHAIGRIGCLLGGCCFGAEWHGPWAVTYTNPIAPASHPSVPRHPTPLYESFGLLVLAFVFALVPIKRVGTGQRALMYAIAYAVLRFLVETTRGDMIRGVFLGALSTSQLTSIALFAFAVAMLARQAMRARREPA
jgi:phosphatidylglycerol:prolipoprotein diacylglycerol transferase